MKEIRKQISEEVLQFLCRTIYGMALSWSLEVERCLIDYLILMLWEYVIYNSILRTACRATYVVLVLFQVQELRQWHQKYAIGKHSWISHHDGLREDFNFVFFYSHLRIFLLGRVLYINPPLQYTPSII